jgi:DNA-binding HxlR family transcriptional regulator
MLPSTYESQNCAIARALEIIGERWTVLVVRDALLGIRRFEDFQARLGVSRAVLSDRLGQLVEHGVMERVRYQQRPDRYEYVLTERGQALWPAISALSQWGTTFMENGSPRQFRHHGCGGSVRAAVHCEECGAELTASEIVTFPTPGAPVSRASAVAEPVRRALSSEWPLLEPVRG